MDGREGEEGEWRREKGRRGRMEGEREERKVGMGWREGEIGGEEESDGGSDE